MSCSPCSNLAFFGLSLFCVLFFVDIDSFSSSSLLHMSIIINPRTTFVFSLHIAKELHLVLELTFF